MLGMSHSMCSIGTENTIGNVRRGRALCRNPAKPVETDLPCRNRAKNRTYYTV